MTEQPETGLLLQTPQSHLYMIRSVRDANGGCDEVDPRTPLFFLSYAHLRRHRAKGRPHEPNRRFIQFFDDLSEGVAELVSRPAGSDPGYMDRSIPDGSRWTGELLAAVGTCQVFVALLSVPYITSPWCGMEWHAFTRRKIVSHSADGTDHETAIIPVTWAPVPHERLPTAVRAIQRFSPSGLPDPDITAQYEREGVVGLLQLQLDDAYQAVIWRLALRIAEFHYGHRVEPRTFRPSELRDIFREQRS